MDDTFIMSQFSEVFQRIETQSYAVRKAVMEEDVQAPPIVPTNYIIDTTTISGSISTTFVDIRFLYRYIPIQKYPHLLSVQYMNAKLRDHESPEPEWQLPDESAVIHGFKHQTSFVIAVDDRAVDVKIFCNGKVNIVGALSLAQAEISIEYVIHMMLNTYRETSRPCFDLAVQPKEESISYLTQVSAYSNKTMRRLKKEQHARHFSWFSGMSDEKTDDGGHIACLRSDHGMTVSMETERLMTTKPFEQQPIRWVPVIQFAHMEVEATKAPQPIHIVQLKMTNIHCVFSIQQFLNRYALFDVIKASHGDRFAVSFDPQKFPAVKVKHLTQRGTAFLFQQGKIVMTGIDSVDGVNQMYTDIVTILQRHWNQLHMRPPASILSRKKKKRSRPEDME